MKPETIALLHRFAEPDAYEFPNGFDYPDFERRARHVYHEVANQGIRVGFEVAAHHQDASFSIALCCIPLSEPNSPAFAYRVFSSAISAI